MTGVLTAAVAQVMLAGPATAARSITPPVSSSAPKIPTADNGSTASGAVGTLHYGWGATAASAPSNASIVGVTMTPSGTGYWEVATDGGVFAFGNAGFYGSMGGQSLAAPVVGMAPTPTGAGYWLVGADGGVYAFGNAGFYGSIPGSGGSGGPQTVAIVPTTTGGGYWEIDADGGVFAYGNAPFAGSLPSHLSTLEVVGATNWSNGYCLALANGTVWCFVPGATPGHVTICSDCSTTSYDPATAMSDTSDHGGLWLVNRVGQVFTYGDAQYEGSVYTAVGGPPWGPISSISGHGVTGYDAVGTDGGTFSFNVPFEGNVSTSSELAPAYAQQIAWVMLPQDNWGTTVQWSDGLAPLWTRESGWRWDVCAGGGLYPNCPYATIAYGIPQGNPGSRMCTQGPPCPSAAPSTAYETNAWTQIMWGFWYIAGNNPDGVRTPQQAYTFDVIHGSYGINHP